MSSISETAELVIAQLVESCTADDRVAALFLGGSLARGEVDEYSDVDLCVIVRGDAYDDVIAARDTFVRAVGEPLFLEDFGDDHMAFAILAGSTELELHFFRAGDVDAIRPGPHRVLLDKDGILASVTFALPEPDRAAQLEQLREYCVNLIRIEQAARRRTSRIGSSTMRSRRRHSMACARPSSRWNAMRFFEQVALPWPSSGSVHRASPKLSISCTRPSWIGWSGAIWSA